MGYERSCAQMSEQIANGGCGVVKKIRDVEKNIHVDERQEPATARQLGNMIDAETLQIVGRTNGHLECPTQTGRGLMSVEVGVR